MIDLVPSRAAPGTTATETTIVPLTLWSCLLLCLGATSDEQPDFSLFETRIRPVLIEHCYDCHSARVAKPKGNLRLDTRKGLKQGGASGPIITPGKPDDSLLIHVLEQTSEVAQMPPKGRLPDPIIADFRAWISQGAPDPRDP